ncbi:MAG: pilin [bacterium]|nr:pilin [bacterium]
MKSIKFVFVSLLLLSIVSLSSPVKVSAAVEAQCDGSGSLLGLPTWYKYLDIGGPNCDIIGPPAADSTSDNIKIDWEQASGRIGLAVVEILMRLVAIIAVGYVIYGGFKFITSQGEPDSAKAARQTIINGMIGLVISLLATGIVRFIANSIT